MKIYRIVPTAAVVVIVSLLGFINCGESPTAPADQSANRPGVSPSPSPSPSVSPSPSPSPSVSPSPSPSPSVSPSPSPSPSVSPSPSPSPSVSPSPSPSPSVSPGPSPSPTPPASDVEFDSLTVAEAKVELDRYVGDQRFEVDGHFDLASESDSIDVLNEDVTVTFGSFSQTVYAGSFSDEGDRFRFDGALPGIKRIEIWDNGDFEIDARDLDLSDLNLDAPVSFSFRIGNDFGGTEIQFDATGNFPANDYKTIK